MTRYGPELPVWLSESPDKLAWYAADTHFVEAWQDVLAASADGSGTWASRFASVILKPDAIVGRRANPTVDWLEAEGFSVVAAERFRFDRHSIRAVWRYQWNVATRARKELVDTLLTASPSLYLLLRGPEQAGPAATVLTLRKGPATPSAQRPGDLRHHLGGRSTLLNYVHTSDEPADLVRELGVLFPPVERRRLIACATATANPSGDAGVRALIDALSSEVPAHDLDVEASLERLRAAAGASRGEIVAALGDQAWEAGRPLAVGDAWDRIVVASHLVTMDVAGLRVLVPGVASIQKAS